MYGRASFDLLRRRVLGLETSPGSDFSCAGTRNHARRSYTLGEFPQKLGAPLVSPFVSPEVLPRQRPAVGVRRRPEPAYRLLSQWKNILSGGSAAKAEKSGLHTPP